MNKPTLDITAQIVGNKAYLVPIGDTQMGQPDFAREKLQRYIDWIKATPDAFTILVGDIFEVSLPGSRATDAFEDIELSLDDALDLAVDMFYPIRGKVLGAIDGNHDARATRTLGMSPVRRLMRELGYKKDEGFATDEINLAMTVGQITYDIKAVHGWGGGRRVGNHLNKVEELSNITSDCDVYMAGHEHTLFCSRFDRELTSSYKGKFLKQYLVGTGCFCYYTRFQRTKALRRPHVGAARIRFNGDKRDVHVSL